MGGHADGSCPSDVCMKAGTSGRLRQQVVFEHARADLEQEVGRTSDGGQAAHRTADGELLGHDASASVARFTSRFSFRQFGHSHCLRGCLMGDRTLDRRPGRAAAGVEQRGEVTPPRDTIDAHGQLLDQRQGYIRTSPTWRSQRRIRHRDLHRDQLLLNRRGLWRSRRVAQTLGTAGALPWPAAEEGSADD